METLGDKIMPKLCSNYYCKNCDYITSKKSSFTNHLASAKHKKQSLGDAGDANYAFFMPEKKYNCDTCNRQYTSRNGLWKHKKSCTEKSDNQTIDKELIMMLLKQNAQLIEHNSELVKNGIHHTTTNSHNTNSNNKTFNLHFFLNETCKDALNISDFVNSIQLQITDLEETGKLGYVEGISNVVLRNLKELDTTRRPIHCSDLKREILYIKDDNEWIKDSNEKEKIKSVIKQVANKNMKKIPEWVKENPDCYNSNSKNNDTYLQIVSNSMSGSTVEEQHMNLNKIITKLAKEVAIDK